MNPEVFGDLEITYTALKRLFFENKFLAKYFVSPFYFKDLQSQINVFQHDNLLSSINVPIRFENKFLAKYYVNPVEAKDFPSTLYVSNISELLSNIFIPFFNELLISYDAVEPPITENIFHPIQDAFVRELKPALNYGGVQSLQVGMEEPDKTTRSLYQFDVFDLPPGEKIEAAILRLFKANQSDHPATIKIYTLNKAWAEKEVTWLNQPGRSAEPVAEVVVPPGLPGVINIDVLGFLDSLQDHGIIIESDDPAIVLTSKEFVRVLDRPALSIFTRSYAVPGSYMISGEIKVRTTRTKDLLSSIVVETNWGFDDFESHIFVHRSDYVYGNDLSSRMGVTRPDLPSSITVVKAESNELESVIYVREHDVNDFALKIAVSKPSLFASLIVRVSDELDLPSTIAVRAWAHSDLYSWGGVTQPEIPSSITARQSDKETLTSSISVRVRGKSDLLSWGGVTQPEIPSWVTVRQSDDEPLASSIAVRAKGHDNLMSWMGVSRPETPSLIRVRQSDVDELHSSVAVRRADFSNLPSKVNSSRPILPSSIMVVRSDESDLSSTIGVPFNEKSDLESTIQIKSGYLKSILIVPEVNYLPASILIRQLDAEDVPSSITVERVTLYEEEGFRISPEIDLSSVNKVEMSKIEWSSDEPEDTSVTIEVSFDGGDTWLKASNGGPVPGVTVGDSLYGKTLLVKQTLRTEINKRTPTLHWVSVIVKTEEMPEGVLMRITSDGVVLVSDLLEDEVEGVVRMMFGG